MGGKNIEVSPHNIEVLNKLQVPSGSAFQQCKNNNNSSKYCKMGHTYLVHLYTKILVPVYMGLGFSWNLYKLVCSIVPGNVSLPVVLCYVMIGYAAFKPVVNSEVVVVQTI